MTSATSTRLAYRTPMEAESLSTRYAPALYTNRTVLRWYLRMLRFRFKHGATLRGAWWDAREIRRIQKGIPNG